MGSHAEGSLWIHWTYFFSPLWSIYAHSEVSRAVDKDNGETVALKKMSLTLPGEANQKEGVSNEMIHTATCKVIGMAYPSFICC